MKVIYFHQHFSTPNGSVGNRSYEMARSLIKRGHDVTIVCGSYNGANTGLHNPFEKGLRKGLCDGIEVIEYELPYANAQNYFQRTLVFLRYAWRSTGLAVRGHHDLVFATSTPLTAGIPGIFARFLTRKTFVFEVRDLWPELPKAMGVITNPIVLGAMSVLEWLSYRAAHRVIALAPGIASGIEKRGVGRSQIDLIPNGCDLEMFSNDVDPWRPDAIGKEVMLAVYSGTFGVANGLNAILDAAAVLKSRGRKGIAILLVGDGKLKSALVAKAKKENLDNVHFHELVPKTKLVGLMKSADIGLQTLANVKAFYFGTSPNKFFDYISAGLPVLNNYPGWLADMIAKQGIGFAVQPNDPHAFADALEKAAADRKQLKEMGGKAKAFAEREFDRAKLARNWVDVIERAHQEAQKK